MNETEQRPTADTEHAARDAFAQEHAADGQPLPPQKSGKLPKSVVAVVVSCLVLNFLMMLTVAVLLVVRVRSHNAAEASVAESVDAHEGEIYIEDDALGGLWISAYSNVEKSTVLTDTITDADGIKAYSYGGVTAKLGLDISEFQTVTDWEAVKAAGVQFVMVRVGWRGYETGELHEDEKFQEHIEGALSAGLPVGVYFFSQAVTPGEARQEADFVLSRIADYDITYPVAFDWEAVNEGNARTYGIENDQLTAVARTFSDAVSAEGYTPMLYFYKHLGYLQYDLSQLSACDFWLSEPGDKPTFYYRYAMWQYETEGSLSGVDGTVDLNLCFENYE